MQRDEKKPTEAIGVFDIDNTWFYGKVYNTELAAALKSKNIKNIILFSDMTLKTERIEERQDLVKFLEDNGFVVHMVATILDYSWGLSFKSLENFFKRFIDLDLTLKKPDMNKINLLLEEFPDIKDLMKGNSLLPRPGVAYAEACELTKIQDEDERVSKLMQCKRKSDYAKLVTDLISIKRRLLHAKGLMFEQLMQTKPEWMQSFIYGDDRNDCLAAVIQANKQFNFPLLPILVSKQNNDSREYYINKIEGNEGLLTLPGDALVRMLAFLSVKDKMSSGLVCKHFFKLLQVNDVWKDEIKQEFGRDKAQQALVAWNSMGTRFFDSYRDYVRQRNESRASHFKLNRTYESSKSCLVNLAVDIDKQIILLTNSTTKQTLNFTEPNLYPMLAQAKGCQGFENIFNLLSQMQDDPFCEKLIVSYSLGTNKRGYEKVDSLFELMQTVKELSSHKENNSRCLLC